MRPGFFLLACFVPFFACSNATSGSGGSSGTPGADGGPSADGSSGSSSGGGGGGTAGALPASTFLYVSRETPDHDVLMAVDATTGESRVVTDLRGDGSEGWTIDGYSLSPDRTRIVIASIYGPTKEDTDTRLSTRRLWTFNIDGSDFRRLTPVFENTAQGRKLFSIEIGDPFFSKDGSEVFYDYGEYWYEGTTLQGASGVWRVSAAGGALPTSFRDPSPCSYVNASVDPKTGGVLLLHSVCIPGQDTPGIHLHSPDGSGAPELLFADTGSLSISLETPRWIADGSGFLFVAVAYLPENGSTRQARSLYAFDMATKQASPLVIPEGEGVVMDGTISPDGSAIVYCLKEGEASNLHLIDLSVDPPTDSAITNDGKSCHPVW